REAARGRHAKRAAGRLRDIDGFDSVAAIHAEQPLLRAVDRGLLERGLRRADVAAGTELFTQRLADIGHVLEIAFETVVDPLHDLLGAIRLLAELREEIAQPLAIEIEQVYLVTRRRQ